MNSTPIKIAVADDHKLMRESIISIVDSMEELTFVLEASNGDELIDKLRKTKNFPDVCLLDISMPQKNGFETMKVLKEEWPELRVLAISMFETEYSVLKMLQLGAKGYLNKNFTSFDQLKSAIVSVYETGYHHSETVSSKALKALNTGLSTLKISDQEMTFLKLACTDLCYFEISNKMGVSKRTVEGYRDSLFLKLGVKYRHSLNVFAFQNGLISFEELNKPLNR